jgi:hypothetical protein
VKNWKTGDTLIAKSSFAKVVASDLSGEQNWVKVRYQNQDFESLLFRKSPNFPSTSLLPWSTVNVGYSSG